MKNLLILVATILMGCASKQIIKTKDLEIKLKKEDCGSYEVKNANILLGYVTKSSLSEIAKKDFYIGQLENFVIRKYSSHYNNYYRVYAFTLTQNGDTIIRVTFLHPSQVASIKEWKCKEKGFEKYTNKGSKFFGRRYPQFFFYNCSKDLFKPYGDPEN